MRIALEFDGTVVREDRPYDDVTTPLKFMQDAREAIAALKAAGHFLIISSGRSSPALLIDPNLNPLVRAGVWNVDPVRWEASRGINQARLAQMIDFVESELAGLIDCIDDGSAGKVSADLYIDNRGLRLGIGPGALSWREVALLWGEPNAQAPVES